MYELEVQHFLRNNQAKIIAGFGWGDVFHGPVNPPSIQFTAGETHSLGKKPVIVTFTQGQVSRTCVLKPRDGSVDQKIVGLCRDINELSPDQRTDTSEDRSLQKGSPPQLPTYTILTPKAENDWVFPDNLPTVTLSEFVGQEDVVEQHTHGRGPPQGTRWPFRERIKEDSIVDDFIIKRLLRLGRTNIEQRKRSLRFLYGVFQALGAVDQHNGNFRFDPDSECPMIPVDMEVISPKAETDMRTLFSPLPLTDKEKELVATTRQGIANIDQPIRIRYVPIKTGTFLEMLQQGTPEGMLDFILSSRLERRKEVDPKISGQLLEKIQQDYINFDIPIFSKVGNKIFYGEPAEGLLLNGQNR